MAVTFLLETSEIISPKASMTAFRSMDTNMDIKMRRDSVLLEVYNAMAAPPKLMKMIVEVAKSKPVSLPRKNSDLVIGFDSKY